MIYLHKINLFWWLKSGSATIADKSTGLETCFERLNFDVGNLIALPFCFGLLGALDSLTNFDAQQKVWSILGWHSRTVY
jgi:hypothetical protein